MNEDQEIKDLFTAEQNRDKVDFPAPAVNDIMSNKRSPSFKWFYAAAAVLALVGLFGLFKMDKPITSENAVNEYITLKLDLTETAKNDPLMAENTSLFEWEAATDVLIKEFDE